MEAVAVQETTKSKPPEQGRGMMRFAIIVLVISQLLPFSRSGAYLYEKYTGRGHGTYQNGYTKGYETDIQLGTDSSGFECHPYAFFILLFLIAAFFTPLYGRPGWSRWLYWAAAILANGCTEMPPPVNQLGGNVGAVALLLIGISLYQRSRVSPEVSTSV